MTDAAAERNYRESINFAPFGFFQSTLDRRLMMVNATFARILGYSSPQDVLENARPEGFYFHPEERDALIARYDPLGEATDLDVLFKKKDGSPVWVQIAFHIVKNDRGEPQYIEGFVCDVSERKRREEALRDSEERFRSIVAGALDAVLTIDAAGRIETFNPAAETIFGYSEAEAVGLDAGILAPAILSAPAGLSELEGLRRTGEVFPLEVSLFAIGGTDGRHSAAFLRDISERREVDRLKDEFVAVVSHDLKTPLTSVSLSLGLLADGTLGPQTPKALDVIAIAEKNLLRMVNLTNDILDLKRLETGRMELALGPIAIEPVIERAVEIVEPVARQTKVSIDTHPSAAWVTGDPRRLVQVVVNLLSNAVKFSSSGSTVEIDVSPRNGWVEVRVRDSGCGIPPEHRERVFEPFRQVRRSDAATRGGSGLGLAICKAIIVEHGGSMGVESEVGKGSTFWFRVPAWTGEAAPKRFRDTLAGV